MNPLIYVLLARYLRYFKTIILEKTIRCVSCSFPSGLLSSQNPDKSIDSSKPFRVCIYFLSTLFFILFASLSGVAAENLTKELIQVYAPPILPQPQLSVDEKVVYQGVPLKAVINDPNPTALLRKVPAPARLVMEPEAAVTASFSITYVAGGQSDAFGEPCYDFPNEAKSVFNAAANIWANSIQSSVPIAIQACWASMGSTTTLGYSGGGSVYRDFSGAPQSGTFYSSSLANALHGSDIDSSQVDMHITYNRNFDWYYGTDANPPSQQHDLMTVVLHEIAHGLNFSGSMRYASGVGDWGFGTNYPNIYDVYMRDGSGNQLINTSLYPKGSTALGSALVSGDIWFHGPSSIAANSNQPVKMYAPSNWNSGSSYSHLDYATFNNTSNQLMVYAISAGEAIHDPGVITMGLLQDLGWNSSTSQATVTTQAATSITATTAVGQGTVTSLGSPSPYQHGVCWNMGGNPTTADSCTSEGAVSSTGAFSSALSGLSPNTSYYVRAYAINSGGTAYGNQVSFTTSQGTLVSLAAAVDNTTLSWSTGGDVIWFGQESVSYYGGDSAQSGNVDDVENSWVETTVSGPGTVSFYWKVSSEADYDYLRLSIDGSMELEISGEVEWQQQTIAVAAGSHTLRWSYEKDTSVSNGDDAGWLDRVVYTGNSTPTLPVLSTEAVTSITSITATGNGTITTLGYPVPTSHGICINTGGSPTTSDLCTDEGVASNTGSFSSGLSSLSPQTTYYARAYAVNSAGTAYGNQVSFSTSSQSSLSLGEAVDNTELGWTTGGNANWFGQTVDSISGGDAAKSGDIDNDGLTWVETEVTGPGILSFYWSVSSESSFDFLRFFIDGSEQNKISGIVSWQQMSYTVTAGSHTLRWSYTKDYSVSAEGDTGWLDKVSFIGDSTPIPPTVTTQQLSSITETTALGHGTIESIGSADLTEHGVCWNTSGGPTIAGNCTHEGAVSSTGAYSSTITGLLANTTYFVRAYGTNSGGTAYGEDVSFTTSFVSTVSIGEAVDNTDMLWSGSGSKGWFGQTSTAYADGDAAQAGAIVHSETSGLSTMVIGPGDLSFYWRASSELAADFLRFFVDDVEQITISGQTGWEGQAFTIPEGAHTIKWLYSKDASVDSFEDTAWVDQIVFSGNAIPNIGNGNTLTGLSADTSGALYYRVSLPSSARFLTVDTYGGSGNADLYLRHGGYPTTAVYDYRSVSAGNSESIELTDPLEGDWFLLIYGASTFDGLTLKVNYSSPVISWLHLLLND